MSSSLSSSVSESKERMKRTACDFCREQKLKCTRTPSETSIELPCVRCSRSGRQCVNNSSKRPGRPRKPEKQQELGGQKRQERKYSETRTTTSSSIEPELSSSSMSSVFTNANAATTTASSTTTLEDPAGGISTSVAMENPSLASVDSWFTKSILNSSADANFRMWDMIDPDLSPDENHILSSSHDHSVLDHPFADPGLAEPYIDINTSRYNRGHQHQQQHSGNNNIAFDFSDNSSSHVQNMDVEGVDETKSFEDLQQDLSKQLFFLQSVSINIAQVTRLTCCGHDMMDANSPDSETMGQNPFARVIESVNQFARLLQTAHRRSHSPVPSMDASGPSLSSVDLLKILSCHILIITIFDAIIGHFDQQTRSDPGLVDSIVRSAPKLRLGGIAVPSQIEILRHILCSLTANNLWPIEILLGLPEEFCVSPAGVQDDSSTQQQRQESFFGGTNERTLFEALLKVDAERSDRNGELSVIDSLKARLARIGGGAMGSRRASAACM